MALPAQSFQQGQVAGAADPVGVAGQVGGLGQREKSQREAEPRVGAERGSGSTRRKTNGYGCPALTANAGPGPVALVTFATFVPFARIWRGGVQWRRVCSPMISWSSCGCPW